MLILYNIKYEQLKDFLSEKKNSFTDSILHNLGLHYRYLVCDISATK